MNPVSTIEDHKKDVIWVEVGIVIYSNDPETVWNAFRFGNFARGVGDGVSVFLLGKGVESEKISTEAFNTKEQMQEFITNGGCILACGSCLAVRESEGSETCPISTMKDLYELIMVSDKILTF